MIQDKVSWWWKVYMFKQIMRHGFFFWQIMMHGLVVSSKKIMHGCQDSGPGTFYLKCHFEKENKHILIYFEEQKK